MTRLIKLTFFLSFIGAFFFVESCKPKPDEVLLTDYLLKHRLLTNIDSLKILNAVRLVLFPTDFKDKAAINSPYDPSLVNVYVIDGEAAFCKSDPFAAQLVGNCQYAGSNIIFVDVSFINGFLRKHKVEQFLQDWNLEENHAAFLLWIVGHELGHLACGHLSGSFDTTSLDHYVSVVGIDNKEELQADSFFVAAALKNDSVRNSTDRLLMNILNAEIRNKVGDVQQYGVGLIFDYTNEKMVHYANRKFHPEYVIRLSRMLELSARMSNDQGLHNMIKSFIRVMKEGAD